MSRRFATTRTHGNKHGYRGVEWERSRQVFRARIESTPTERGRWLGRFATAEEAARAYDEAAREEYGADAYLNFPGPEERHTEPSMLQDGLCPLGHDLSVEGKVNARGERICKACNRAAARRYYARKRVASGPAI